MSRCPLTYEESEQRYSQKGLRRLAKGLKSLQDFPYSAEEQIKEALVRASKMSIQGVQPKLSVRLNVGKGAFEIVDTGGQYIFKPQTPNYPEMPENEDLTMRLARQAGIEVPVHGLLFCKDGSLTYFIKRFDRKGKNQKIPVEDFAQLSGKDRDTKYDSSMEKIVSVIDEFCTFPAVEKLKLFKLTVFNFLTGNEDMHLKNFSLISREPRVELTPAYDLVNSSIATNSGEEIALPLKGRKSKIQKEDLLEYYAKERLGLTDKSIIKTLQIFGDAYKEWQETIHAGFLSSEMQQRYLDLLDNRRRRLGFETNKG